MQYEGAVFRPPSEAYSLIIQATIGCAHNRCTFCAMYKNERFRIREVEDIIKDLKKARAYHKRVDRIFLADGDALSIPTAQLKAILVAIKEIFPECKRVGIYATPKDILRKSLAELQELKELGLGILYMGLETGSDTILKEINKGITSAEAIEAGRKAMDSGIELSITIISGLGGREKWQEHGIKTGEVLSQIDPDYVGLLTLMLVDGTETKRQVDQGELQLLTPKEVMLETKLMLENMNVTNCVFRSNHASNYVSLRGTLPFDQEALTNQIQGILTDGYDYKKERHRGL